MVELLRKEGEPGKEAELAVEPFGLLNPIQGGCLLANKVCGLFNSILS